MDQSIRRRIAEDDLDYEEVDQMDNNHASDRNDQDRDYDILDTLTRNKFIINDEKVETP